MPGEYLVCELRAADVARAFVLVQHLFLAPDWEEWRAATATQAQRRNWLSVVDSQGVVRGLCFIFSRQIGERLRLEVPIFAAFSLFDENHIAKRLFKLTRSEAFLRGCDSIHFWPAARKGWSVVEDPMGTKPDEEGILYDLRSSSRPITHPV